MRTKNTHPVLGLFVSTENRRAIELYKEFGFTDDGFEPEEDNGMTYQQMYAILDENVYNRMLDEEWKKLGK